MDTAQAKPSLEEEMLAMLKTFVSVLDHCEVSTGCCMCGDSIAAHSYSTGHPPVDSGTYHANLAHAEAVELIAKAEVALSQASGSER